MMVVCTSISLPISTGFADGRGGGQERLSPLPSQPTAKAFTDQFSSHPQHPAAFGLVMTSFFLNEAWKAHPRPGEILAGAVVNLH